MEALKQNTQKLQTAQEEIKNYKNELKKLK